MRRVFWLLVCLLAAANDRMVMASSAWASSGQLAGGSAGSFRSEVAGVASKFHPAAYATPSYYNAKKRRERIQYWDLLFNEPAGKPPRPAPIEVPPPLPECAQAAHTCRINGAACCINLQCCSNNACAPLSKPCPLRFGTTLLTQGLSPPMSRTAGAAKAAQVRPAFEILFNSQGDSHSQ